MYRLNRYVHVMHNEKYLALFNFMNAKTIVLTNPEDIHFVNQLKQSGCEDDETPLLGKLLEQDFAIKAENDEKKLLDYCYDRYRYNSDKAEIIMILSETCNFRCEYCYEEYAPAVMSEEVEEGVLFFVNDLVKTYSLKKVVISWFGGEPTLYKNRVINFMGKLSKTLPQDIQIRGYMTTNGYLLDKESFLDYYHAGINGYQITLDGFERTHDELRKLKNGAPTWKAVFGNLKEISRIDSDDIDVTLRINYNEDVMDDIFEFIDFAKEEFGNRFRIHVHPISKLGKEDRECICNYAFAEIAEEILAEFFASSDVKNDFSLLRCQTFGEICYASLPNSFVVDANGNIRKCTVSLGEEKNKVGIIEDSRTFHMDFYSLSKWTECRKNSDECDSCTVYPVCMARLCPNAVISGDNQCRMNKYTIFKYIESVVEQMYQKSLVHESTE